MVTTALRELVIAIRGRGRSPRKILKVSNLILAAPDLNFSVARQRLIAEQFGPSIGQITVYMNKSDSALRIAQKLMTGQRFGTLTIDDLEDSERAIFGKIKNVNFVDVEDVEGLTGHGYFRKNAGVLSDIALLIRDGAEPGTPTRPLQKIGLNFWNLKKGYPF